MAVQFPSDFQQNKNTYSFFTFSILDISVSELQQWKSLLCNKFRSELNWNNQKYQVTELTGHKPLHTISLVAFDSEIVVAHSQQKLHFWYRERQIAHYEPKVPYKIYDMKLCNENLLCASETGLFLCEKFTGSEIQKYGDQFTRGCALSDVYVAGVFNKEILL